MSKIEWTEKTWNPVTGCRYASAGCKNCYAASLTRRLEGMGQDKYAGLIASGHFNGAVKTHEDDLEIPKRRKQPTTWFVCSMSDLFYQVVPWSFVDRVWSTMTDCPQHTFQVLTKRPASMANYIQSRRARGQRLLPNVWVGTSIENQAAADVRVQLLCRCHADVRFLSIEPMIGPIKLDLKNTLTPIHWVIVGGESGPKARPIKVDWIRSIVLQCQAAGVPVFVKQLGSVWAKEKAKAAANFSNPSFEFQISTPIREFGSKGGNPHYWPTELQVREMPAAMATHWRSVTGIGGPNDKLV